MIPLARRSALSLATALVTGATSPGVVGASVPATHPDAVLLALCNEALEYERQMHIADIDQRRCSRRDPAAEALRRKSDEFFDLFVETADRAAAVPAKTTDGYRAKARVALADFRLDDPLSELIQALLEDIAGRA